ncbi:LURP1-like domain [Macleaya cordata]|uniref:LURP1-like domain n=1 Tax=Macleaya cordata TaxID=56857 RepID=A0A200QQF4_MACCD|nr:LURP1-like domain [Macleaya cordata]
MVAPINQQFCAPIPLKLTIVDHHHHANFIDVKDVNENIVFHIKDDENVCIHDRRFLLDANGDTLVTLQSKLRSVDEMWQVFKGSSKHAKDRLFIAKQQQSSSPVGSWLERSCTIFTGDSNMVIAQIHKKPKRGWEIDGMEYHANDMYMVTVYPNIDYAFIVALTGILHAIHGDNLKAPEIVNNVVGATGIVGGVLGLVTELLEE